MITAQQAVAAGVVAEGEGWWYRPSNGPDFLYYYFAVGGASTEGSLAEVFVVEPLGRDNLVDVRIDNLHLFVLADPRQPLKIGDPARLQFDGDKVQLFDLETEYSLLWK